MAVTTTLVEQGHNRLRYLVIDDGGEGSSSVTITTTGGATPDLLTDSLSGPLKKCALAFTNGIGLLPPGAKTQAQSRAIWLADNSDVVLGNGKVSRTLPRATMRSGVAPWTVDANVDGGGHPTVIVAHNATVGSAYIDIETQGAIGI